jgi:hypothetical protein
MPEHSTLVLLMNCRSSASGIAVLVSVCNFKIEVIAGAPLREKEFTLPRSFEGI